ncbi:MAG: ABC transporter permease [Thermofilaceae archaeon]|nr:ABC transporter permease [Thermofilaceae archaeon]MCX8179947.1 ABC transporter permease [Thermofilaceae archaeon]MDW8004747.1 ABC transporter permease [Thermofilaceae archaeon]
MKRKGGESFQNTKFTTGVRTGLLELKAAAETGVRIYFRYPAWLIADIITTPAWLVLLVLPILLFLPREQWTNQETLTMLFWGWIFWDIVSAGLWNFGNAVRREQQTGTLEFLLLTNTNRAILFSRDIFSRFISITLSLAYVYFFFTTIFGVQALILNPFGVAASLLVGLFVSMGFGLVYGALVLRFKNVGPLNNILQFILLGLGGAFFPVTSLPEYLRLVSYALPHTYAADLLRHYGMGTETLLPLPQEWAIMLAYTFTLLVLGIKALETVEKKLKRSGQLGTY